MGFKDFEKNLALLKSNENDLYDTIWELEKGKEYDYLKLKYRVRF